MNEEREQPMDDREPDEDAVADPHPSAPPPAEGHEYADSGPSPTKGHESADSGAQPTRGHESGESGPSPMDDREPDERPGADSGEIDVVELGEDGEFDDLPPPTASSAELLAEFRARTDQFSAPTQPDIIPGAAGGDILPGTFSGASMAPPTTWADESDGSSASSGPVEPWMAQLDQLRYEIRRVIVGQHRVVERVLVALLAGGHCLLEGAPGLGKTKLLSTLAQTVGGSFSRIQFTPDLIPSDIVGTRIYRGSTERFDVERGPIFANLVLADEINRAPAKVQSALLEVMAEHQVTIGGETHAVPDPFLVLATQNPIEHEGVYALPEAQRDRFLMRVPVDFPTPAQEAEIVRRGTGSAVVPDTILSVADVCELQRLAAEVCVDPRVADYAVRLVLATRTPYEHGLGELDGLIDYGASPRATLGLLAAGKALAVLRGRRWVSPQEVFDVAYDVLNHRLVLSFEALADGTTVDEVLVKLLSTVKAPVGVTNPNS